MHHYLRNRFYPHRYLRWLKPPRNLLPVPQQRKLARYTLRKCRDSKRKSVDPKPAPIAVQTGRVIGQGTKDRSASKTVGGNKGEEGGQKRSQRRPR